VPDGFKFVMNEVDAKDGITGRVTIMNRKTAALGLVKMSPTKNLIAGNDDEFGHSFAGSVRNDLEAETQYRAPDYRRAHQRQIK
jgi:hypothetical protein